ncbi:MAG: SagB family peptide dehydrogenase [Desulfobacteraceae bacterium]|nr:SagB family peptide dehydrogenase [Desulfobacteraceae bacterium]
MNHSVLISFVEGVELNRVGTDQAAFEWSIDQHQPQFLLKNISAGLYEALESVRKGVPTGLLVGLAMQAEGMHGVGKIMEIMRQLAQHAMLRYSLQVGEDLFARLEPLTLYFRFEGAGVGKDARLALSRFAYLRNDHGVMTLGSPLGYAKLRLIHPAALKAVHSLLKPQTAAELAESMPELDEESALSFMNFLANAGAVQESDGERPTREDSDPALAQWAFHDLLFHAGNRLGRHSDPYGGTFPFKDRFAPLPVVKKRMSDQVIPLYKPDLDRLAAEDIPFSRVLEGRQSIRAYGDAPLSVDQLGEFLYRSAHIKHIADEAGVSWRPSPGGGALHELEIYPVVQACEGLDFGLYHYDPLAHELCRLPAPEPLVQHLLGWGEMAGQLEQPPQILLVLAARFQRIQIKYQSVTYAVILKNVGCLYQTMYLVATAMGLAPCALGGGDSDLFSRAAGLDYYAETSVGEFLLGSGPAEPPKRYARPRGLE